MLSALLCHRLLLCFQVAHFCQPRPPATWQNDAAPAHYCFTEPTASCAAVSPPVAVLAGGASLSAKSSSYLDNCCLLISSYTGPGMNATSLLLFTDPDSSRSTPPGYYWPYDGSEGLGPAGTASGGSGAPGSGLSSASLAGLIVGVCAAAVLAGVLVWVLVARQRRRRKQQYDAETSSLYKLQSSSGDTQRSSSNSGYGAPGYGKDQFGRALGPDGHPVTDVAVIGSGSLQDQQNYQAGFSQGYSQALQRASASQSGGATSGSGTAPGPDTTGSCTTGPMGSEPNGGVLGNKRWQKLTTAISSKVQDIHQQRLRTALMQSQRTGIVRFGGPPSASRSPGVAPPTAGNSFGSLHASGGGPHNSYSGSGTQVHAGSSAGKAGTGTFSGSDLQSQAEDSSMDKANVLDLKELIGRGAFGIVCW